jgi:antitoxin CcdA
MRIQYAHLVRGFIWGSYLATAVVTSTRKQAANVSIRRDLLLAAKKQGINLSATLEAALQEKLRRKKARQWTEDNREAIAAYNDHVSDQGMFGDRLRRF